MTAAQKDGWRALGKHLMKHGAWGVVAAILLQAFGPSIAEAVADRITGRPDDPVNIEAVTSNAVARAVQVSDDHLDRRANTIESQLNALVKEQTRMADKQAIMSERMGEIVGELKRIQ